MIQTQHTQLQWLCSFQPIHSKKQVHQTPGLLTLWVRENLLLLLSGVWSLAVTYHLKRLYSSGCYDFTMVVLHLLKVRCWKLGPQYGIVGRRQAPLKTWDLI